MAGSAMCSGSPFSNQGCLERALARAISARSPSLAKRASQASTRGIMTRSHNGGISATSTIVR